MKRWKKFLAGVLVMAMMLSCLHSLGLEVKAEYKHGVSGDFKYLIDDKDEVWIDKYTGKGGDVVIPSKINGKKVSYIGEEAFRGCRGLTGVKIPNTVESIGWYAFQDCSSLKSLKIPDSVTDIGIDAFRGCSSLKSIIIPANVISMSDSPIGYNVFEYCSSLESIKVAEENPKYDSRDNCNAIIETKNNVFITGCSSSKIPNGVKKIYDGAFEGCSGLTSIKIPSSVTSIGHSAFRDCSGLTRVTIPSGVTSIEFYAFYDCSKLKSITIPSSVTTMKTMSVGWISSKTNGTPVKKPDFVIYGKHGSEAERYAKDNGFTFKTVKAAEQTDSKISCSKTVYKAAYGAKPFKINATSKSKMTFTSSKPKIAAVDKNTGKVTIKNTGIATITIKAGSTTKKVTIKVRPKKPSVKTAKAAEGRKLTVKWAKDKMALGYQVQISTDKNFKENVTSKDLSRTSYTFTKLKTGRKYYVRIRSYKKSGKETLYSTWSKAKLSSKIKG